MPDPHVVHYINPNESNFFKTHGPLVLDTLKNTKLCYPPGTLICKLGAPQNLHLDPARIIESIESITKEKVYDTHYIWTYLKAHTNTQAQAQKLNCITFTGLLLESLNILPKSTNPVRAYIPGKLKRQLLKLGYKQSFFKVDNATPDR
jgi:hypothetical protein